MLDPVKVRFGQNNSRIKIVKLCCQTSVQNISHNRSGIMIGCLEQEPKEFTLMEAKCNCSKTKGLGIRTLLLNILFDTKPR
jgi:hypothetical protein